MTRFAILALCLGAQLCSAQSTPSADLKTLKSKYEQDLAVIQADSDKALTNSVQGYADALKALGQKLQGAGDLDGILAVKKETERFGKEKAIPEGAVVADNVGLRELQLYWQKMPETIDINKSRKIVKLSKGHIAALEVAKKQLTTQGKVDEAVELKNEIERVRTSAEVTAAEFVLTSASVDSPPKTNKVAKVIAGPQRVDPLKSLRDSLVLYYSFDRDEGGSVTDKSGKNNRGVVEGAEWVEKGKVGGAYKFSGGPDRIITSSRAIRKSSADSIAVWFYAYRFNPNDENTIFGISAPRGVNDGVFSYRIGLGRPNGMGPDYAVGFTPGSWCRDNSAAPAVSDIREKRWYHVVGVYNRGKIQLFVDGQGQKKVQFSLGPTPESTALIGCIGNSVGMFESRGFNGIIDELMFFDRALTDAEVKSIYSAQK
jgi:Concanavalin A-like lectin/glucanases superfamily